jgi:predicted DNA repair protein MutK
MASGFFILLDDIATILDDVAAMTKVAVQKTAGVLGDDLALNAQQVSGVDANRELPIVFAVARGSAINKLILIPLALLLSYYFPPAIDPLMIFGGSFLCFEGVEKILHKFLHSHQEDEEHQKSHHEIIATPEIDVVSAEKEKIRGAVRTDFILSAEIVVISLGVVAKSPILTQIGVLSAIGAVMTIGVYGLVAGIVKLDDLGIWLSKSKGALRSVGAFILLGSPYLMRGLSIAGTAAMFLVGGGILVHKVKWIHNLVEPVLHYVEHAISFLTTPTSMLLDAVAGIAVGLVAVLFIQLVKYFLPKKKEATPTT